MLVPQTAINRQLKARENTLYFVRQECMLVLVAVDEAQLRNVKETGTALHESPSTEHE
jgi:hypothetical protein